LGLNEFLAFITDLSAKKKEFVWFALYKCLVEKYELFYSLVNLTDIIFSTSLMNLFNEKKNFDI